jgi:hypothetical protein
VGDALAVPMRRLLDQPPILHRYRTGAAAVMAFRSSAIGEPAVVVVRVSDISVSRRVGDGERPETEGR